MTELLKPDLCVIGAGSAGLSVAAIAASFGVPVVLIERDRMGGECLNSGCVPSKALIAAGNLVQAIREGEPFGLEQNDPRVDMARVREHVRDVVQTIAPNDSAERFTALGVRVVRGSARFTGPRSLAVGPLSVEARRYVIATGSGPALPPIPGLGDVPTLTNETIFDLAQRPERLMVIGGGPIGVELAQAHRRLGAEVTLIETARLLPREDEELAGILQGGLLEEGVELHTGVTIERLAHRGEAIVATLRRGDESWTIEASHILIATGRRPVTDGLGLELAGVAVDRSGVVVDKGLRTTNRRVYAIGDCAGAAAGPYKFTHVANYHAGLVIRSALFRLPVRVDNRAIPRVTYTDPEIASVGLTEEEARARDKTVRILRWPVAENDRAQTERRSAGLVKAMVTPRGRILGCAIASAHAGELIVPWCLAIANGLKIQNLAQLIFPYPTYSEVTKRAAVEFLRPAAQGAWARRAIAVARWFG